MQTFLCIVLVLFIAFPYIKPFFQVPKKDFSDELIGEKVGHIYGWEKEKIYHVIQNVVNFQQHIFLLANNALLRYDTADFGINPISKYLSGSYFSSTPKDLDISFFDIDSNMNLYFWQYKGNQILKFNNSQLETSFNVPGVKIDDDIIGLKVTDKYLLLFFTFRPNIPYTSTVNTKTISSYVLICDLTSKEKKFEKIVLQNPLAWVDRSEDEIAILSMNGEVSTYTVQNMKLNLKKNWKIVNYSSIFLNGNCYPLLFSKSLNQMIVKVPTIPYAYYFLYPISKNEFKAILLKNKNIEGVLKMNYKSSEKLALIQKDTDSSGFNSLYFFKD